MLKNAAKLSNDKINR